MELAEVACCEADHVGTWYGEWEPCVVLSEDEKSLRVRCLSDQLIVVVPFRLVRKLKKCWLCPKCTFLNSRAEEQCTVCHVGIQPHHVPQAHSTTTVTQKDIQKAVLHQQEQINKINSSFTIYEVAACDSAHVGIWNGLWEECKLLKRGASGLCDVKILSDGEVCQNVSCHFVREKYVCPLVDRKWV